MPGPGRVDHSPDPSSLILDSNCAELNAMPEVEEAGFSCIACGRQYRWKAELAGKSVKCKCGAAVKVPREMGAPTPVGNTRAAAAAASTPAPKKKAAAPVAASS